MPRFGASGASLRSAPATPGFLQIREVNNGLFHSHQKPKSRGRLTRYLKTGRVSAYRTYGMTKEQAVHRGGTGEGFDGRARLRPSPE